MSPIKRTYQFYFLLRPSHSSLKDNEVFSKDVAVLAPSRVAHVREIKDLSVVLLNEEFRKKLIGRMMQSLAGTKVATSKQ